MTRKTVVIGGGAIGLSVAYHLVKAGFDNVLLLERELLTSGTSWHAAGIVGPLRSSKSLTELAQYGIRLFDRLEQETGQSTGYCQTGGLWLAQSAERLTELKRIAAMGKMHNLDTAILNPEQVAEKVDLLHVDDLVGALWVEQDGQINPVDLCMTYAKGARQGGAEIREHARVIDLVCHGERITEVVLADGSAIEAETVVNCAGLWARELATMAGVMLPLRAVEHLYLVSESADVIPIPCPIIRDLDNAIYLKGDAGKLVLGTFEANPKIWRSAGSAVDPPFVEFGEDWDHIEPMLQAGIHRLPLLAELGVERLLNGPESFTPDTRQIMGRAQGLDNFYVAAGFNSIGIMSSAGVGKAMAEWIRDDCPPVDLWEVDILRFAPADSDDDFLDQRVAESVHNQFAMHWPVKQYETGRYRKKSVWHDILGQHGAVFGTTAGWERPLWFAHNAAEKVLDYSYDQQCWWQYAERESKQLMHSGAIFELSPFSKFIISGPHALTELQSLCCRKIDISIGQVVYCLILNHRGGIEMECTITRLQPGEFLLVSGVATRQKDRDWLHRGLSSMVKIEDVTDQYAVLGVMGPNAARLLQASGASRLGIDEFPWSRSKNIEINGQQVRASRISYVGENGWELMIPVASACAVLSTIIGHMAQCGMSFAGHLCLESCRLEKGYRHWGHDIGPEDTPGTVGLDFLVHRNASFDFCGRDALLTAKPVSSSQSILLEIMADRPLLLHDEPVYVNDELAGRTTSGGIGFRTGKALAFASIDHLAASGNAQYEVDIAGSRFPAQPLLKPPYDPDGRRMRQD